MRKKTAHSRSCTSAWKNIHENSTINWKFLKKIINHADIYNYITAKFGDSETLGVIKNMCLVSITCVPLDRSERNWQEFMRWGWTIFVASFNLTEQIMPEISSVKNIQWWISEIDHTLQSMKCLLVLKACDPSTSPP